LVFGAGFSVGPFSLGQQGDWRVQANGVANVHVYLWFDGLTLHAARLQGGPEAWLDGAPLREDWSPLADGSELRFGTAKVVISTEDNLVPASPTVPAAEATQTPPHSPAEPSKGARAPSRIDRLGLTRRGTITWRGVLLLACGVPALVLVWLAMTGSSRPPHKPVPAPSTRSSAVKVGINAPAQTPIASAGSPTADGTPDDALGAAGGASSGEATASVEAAPSVPHIQRLEQQAADAVLRGDFQVAADIYGNLLTLVPSSQAFAVAKRVATRKAGLAVSGR
jgi:hypothetical protein